MTSRTTALGALLLAPVLLLASACGGDDKPDHAAASGPDRSSFVDITARGMAALVDKHLGDQVKSYAVFSDEPGGKVTQRTIEVRLRGADPRDSFLVSVYPENGSGGKVVKGDCSQGGAAADPQAKVSCSPAPEGGNVTITHLAFGLSADNTSGTYLSASGTGPEEREASAAYESFTATMPISDKDLRALLGDPYLGWQTDAKFNEAGRSLEVSGAKS